MVKFLLARGSDPSLRDKQDFTALDYADAKVRRNVNVAAHNLSRDTIVVQTYCLKMCPNACAWSACNRV